MTSLAQPEFPPLLKGVSVGQADPFAVALAAVREEVEPGLIHFAEAEDTLRAAITLAPENPLERAIGAVVAVALGLADAIGALAPPEVAVQFDWPDRIKVNGAHCGGLGAAASTRDPLAEPDWLVVGVELAMARQDDDDPGARPDTTTLHAEGCGEMTVPMLLESWSRHTLLWIHHFMNDGFAPLHEAWRGRLDRIGSEVSHPAAGHFVGLDEHGGMLLRAGESTRILPLTTMLESP